MKIYLHIGLEKTGTTSVQHFLSSKREELLEKKILYPKSLNLPNNEFMSVAFRNTEYIDDLRIKHNVTTHEQILLFRNRIKTALQNEIALHNPDILIISNEHISSRIKEQNERENLMDFLTLFSKDITMIVYLRRQDRFLESLYSTAIMSGNIYNVHDFFNSHKNREDLHFDSFLKAWEKFIERKMIKVRVFEKDSLYKNDIVEDFIKTLALDIKKEMNFESNTSIGYKKLAFLRNFNVFSPIVKNNKLNFYRGNIVNSLKNIIIKDDFKIKLTLPQLTALSSLYDSENQKISKEYFSSDKNIFTFELINRKENFNINMRDHFEIFSKLWENRQKELERLKVKNMLLHIKLAVNNDNMKLAESTLQKILNLQTLKELKLSKEIKEIEDLILNTKVKPR